MLELTNSGICGVMPGLAVSDVLQLIWDKTKAGGQDAAYELFTSVLPQIAYSLQSMDFFHHAEKSLLVARGLLPRAAVREATLTVCDVDREHMEFLNRKVVDFVRRYGISIRGASSGASA